MIRIEETEVNIETFGKKHKCIVSGVYYPARKATKFEPPESEEFELALTTESGADITGLLEFNDVYLGVVNQLKEMKDAR